jgi:2-polyprenyl-3-methyl-5-hydroxy-6-metoxy-1,4-benzoquinol methylase
MISQHLDAVDRRDASHDRYCIDSDFSPNPVRRHDGHSTEYWTDQRIQRSGRFQYHVYSKARRLAQETKARTIVDVGCGVGTKLQKFFGNGIRAIGIDTPESITICQRLFPDGSWLSDDFENPTINERGIRLEPDIIVCADVIEHLERPERLMDYLASLASSETLLVLSTPDRERSEGKDTHCPTNKEHVREWSGDEFATFVQYSGWELIEHQVLLPFRLRLDRMSASYIRGRVRSWLPLKTCQVIVGRRST